MISLLVDSTCDFPESFFSSYPIIRVPLQVYFNGKNYKDGVDIHFPDMFEGMRQGIVPKTSQTSMQDLYDAFENEMKQGHDFFFLTVSSGVSGTYQSAVSVLNDLQPSYPGHQYTVIDSCGGSLASGLIALQMARWISQNKSYEDIKRLTLAMIEKVELLFVVPNLEWLVKGGRVQKQVGYVGDKLSIKPILDVENKTMHVIKIARGIKGAMRKIVDIFMEKSKSFPDQLVAIAYADDISLAYKLRDMILEKRPNTRIVICEIGCVIGTHIGLGCTGIFYFHAPVEDYDLLNEQNLHGDE